MKRKGIGLIFLLCLFCVVTICVNINISKSIFAEENKFIYEVNSDESEKSELYGVVKWKSFDVTERALKLTKITINDHESDELLSSTYTDSQGSYTLTYENTDRKDLVLRLYAQSELVAVHSKENVEYV